MARLPQPGGDAGNWGEILNEYLLQAHATDGSLKQDTVGAAQLKPNAVTNAAIVPGSITNDSISTNATIAQNKIANLSSDLSSKATDTTVVHKTGDEAIGGIKTFSVSPVVPDGSFSISKTAGLQSVLDAKIGNKLRQHDVRGIGAIPGVMSNTPSVSASNTSAYTGAVLTPPWMSGAYTFFGGIPSTGTVFPDSNSFGVASMYTKTSLTPWGAETELDLADATGRFEVQMKPSGSANTRIAIAKGAGPYEYITSGPTLMDATNQYFLITLGAPGRYRVRLEFSGEARFYGIAVPLTEGVRAVPMVSQRLVVIGDSFTEPTISDNNPWTKSMGWVQKLGQILDINAISCGLGGTGYVNPGSNGRVKFRDRSSDWLPLLRTGDILMFAGGINDTSYDASQIAAEAAACFALCPPGVELVVLSPFWPRGAQTYSANLLLLRDVIKSAALAAGGKFLDVLSLPIVGPQATSTTLASNSVVTNTSISTVNPIPNGTWIQIGNDINAEVRMVTGQSGSGPYTLNVTGTRGGQPAGGPLTRVHSAGDPVVHCGNGIVTGTTGRQGTPSNDGTGDRYTGPDSTHPTGPGHANIATQVAQLYMRQLS